MEEKIKIGITHGDINGISYEIILKTLLDPHIYEICTPIVYGSSKVAGVYKKELSGLSGVNFNIITSPEAASLKTPNLINCSEENIKMEIGASTADAGKYAIEALSRATTDLKEGLIDAIVTCPINKSNVQSIDFHFKGHTEYFADKFESNQLMFMVSDQVKIGMLTNHEAICDVKTQITEESIIEKLTLINNSLIADFAITNPKIAVLSLNPHAGDNGVIGDEEANIISPAIQLAKSMKIDAFGPFPADGIFTSGNYAKYDAILAMYHDQGMIPFKILAGDNGVNFTAGLSVVRTSPAHGTAYDIAGKNIADPLSLRYAIYSAIDIYKNRKINAQITKNPLPYYSKDTWGRDQSASDIVVKEQQD